MTNMYIHAASIQKRKKIQRAGTDRWRCSLQEGDFGTSTSDKGRVAYNESN
jgi:hypothetical protein